MVTDNHISDRGVPQGARESPLMFVMLADEILGGLRPQWHAWTLRYPAQGTETTLCCFQQQSLFGQHGCSLLRSLRRGRPWSGLRQKTHLNSSQDLEGEVLHVLGRILSGSRLGGRARNTERRYGVLQLQKPLLCNPLISVSERVKTSLMSILSSVTWLSGCWTLSKQQEDSFSGVFSARCPGSVDTGRAPSPTS